jgi:hypothetical protein
VDQNHNSPPLIRQLPPKATSLISVDFSCIEIVDHPSYRTTISLLEGLSNNRGLIYCDDDVNGMALWLGISRCLLCYTGNTNIIQVISRCLLCYTGNTNIIQQSSLDVCFVTQVTQTLYNSHL